MFEQSEKHSCCGRFTFAKAKGIRPEKKLVKKLVQGNYYILSLATMIDRLHMQYVPLDLNGLKIIIA